MNLNMELKKFENDMNSYFTLKRDYEGLKYLKVVDLIQETDIAKIIDTFIEDAEYSLFIHQGILYKEDLQDKDVFCKTFVFDLIDDLIAHMGNVRNSDESSFDIKFGEHFNKIVAYYHNYNDKVEGRGIY